MYARVSRYRVPTDKLAEDIAGAEETQKRVVSELPGSLGLYYLVDRATGQTMSITLWDSEQAMNDSESGASSIRQETTSAVNAQVTEIERYEVVAQPSKVPAGMR